MNRQDVNYIWEQSKRYKELLGVRQISLQLKDIKKASACRIEADRIKLELYHKYGVII